MDQSNPWIDDRFDTWSHVGASGTIAVAGQPSCTVQRDWGHGWHDDHDNKNLRFVSRNFMARVHCISCATALRSVNQRERTSQTKPRRENPSETRTLFMMTGRLAILPSAIA